MRWFSADLHFYHDRANKFGKRPWTNVEDMNRGIIDNFKSVIKPKDELWILGDFAYKDKKGEVGPIFHELAKGLSGIHLVIGNHDSKYVLSLPWTSVQHYKAIHEDGENVIMSHYPSRSWNKMFNGSYHLFGHEHGNIKDYSHFNNNIGKGGSCDVGVDSWDWKPVSFAQIKERIINTGVKNPDLFNDDGSDRTQKRT